MRKHLLALLIGLSACAASPGYDAMDADLAPCVWTAELIVNGERITDFRLAGRRPVGREPLGVFAHIENGRHDVRPGRFELHLPNGHVTMIDFPPGGTVHSRIELQTPVIEFTIEREFHEWLLGLESFDAPSLDARWALQLPAPRNLLADALAGYASRRLVELTPDQPVRVPLIPAYYELHPGPNGNREVNFPMPLDLSDPSTKHVHLAREGWPGVRRYELAVTSGLAMDLNNIHFTAWDTDYAYFMPGSERLVGFHPDGGVPIAVRVPGQAVIMGWMLPGTREVTRDMVRGDCAIEFTNLGAESLRCYAFWEKSGITFYLDEAIYTEPLASLRIDNLPSGPATLVVRRELNDQRVQFASVDLTLSAKTDVNVADLQWQRAGRVEFRLTDPRTQVISATHRLAGGVEFDTTDRPGRLLTQDLAPGDHHFLITIPGRAPHTRTIRVKPGRRTIIELP